MKKTIIGLPAKPPFPKKKKIKKTKSDKQLYPYQKKGVLWLDEHNGTGLIGDDMGLGKSCQALTYLKIHPELRPVLIVCPASLKLNWQREITKWTDEESFIITKKKYSVLPDYPFYIINYDIMAEELKIINPKTKKIKKVLKDTSWIFKLGTLKLKVIIGDEIQALANLKSIRTKAFYALKKANKKTKFISLSGTPIKNRPMDFFSLLNMLDPYTFPSRWKYGHLFCDPKHNGFGWNFNGATNMETLSRLINTIMIRRTKDEVLKDLPPKQKIMVPMETDLVELKNYKTATEQFKQWAKDHINAGLEAQTNIDRLKQLAYMTKRNSVIKWIEQFLESENKLVVGAFHTNAINDLYEHFKTIAVKIDGKVTGADRQKAVDIFQSSKKTRLIICQLLCVPGLNLTAAAATCTVEFSWSPSDHEQFEDRVHRIGQEADSIFAYYLIAPETVDEDCMAMVNNKFNVIKNLLDGKTNADLFENNLIKSILKKYGSKML